MVKKYFVSLDENGIVDNYTEVDYSHSLIEYNKDTAINLPQIGATYDAKLNAFIPPKPEETYILNTKTYEWEPNPSREYNVNGDTCRWSSKKQMWVLLVNWSDAEHL